MLVLVNYIFNLLCVQDTYVGLGLGLWRTRFLGFQEEILLLVLATNLSQRCFNSFNFPFLCKINTNTMTTKTVTATVMPTTVPGGVGGGGVGSVIKQKDVCIIIPSRNISNYRIIL